MYKEVEKRMGTNMRGTSMNIDGIIKKVDVTTIICFASAFVIGLINNLSLIATSLTNPDGNIIGAYSTDFIWNISIGRWGLSV